MVNKFQQLAKEYETLVIYTNEDIREIPDLLGLFAKQFKEQGAPLKKLEDRHRIYLKEKKLLEADPEAPKNIGAFSGRMIAKGGKELARNLIPGASIILDQFDTDAIGEKIGELTSYLVKKKMNKDEVELLVKPVEVLTLLFLEDLKDYVDKPKICFFFDTYEKTDIYLEEWLGQLLEGKFGDAPDNILICIAGQEELNPNKWNDFAGSISTISLEPFTQNEARNYLSRKKVTDPATIDTIIHLSGCLPVLLEVLAKTAPNSPDEINDRCDTAVERFLKWIDEPILRDLALHAALPNLLNEDIIKQLLSEGADAVKLFYWLRNNPFVYKRDDHWAYHAHVRELMLRYQRQLSLETWEGQNIKLAEYYLQRANTMGLEGDTGWKDKTWREWMLEHHYHQLLAAPKKAIIEAIRAFARVFRLNGFSSAIPWSELIVQAEQITQETEFGIIIRRGVAAWQSDENEIAIQMFDLINKLEWLVDSTDKCFFHFLEAHCWNTMSNLPKAISQLQKAIETKPDFANAYQFLGDTLQASDDLQGAIAQYRKAIELNLENNLLYTGLGLALLRSSNLTEAIALFQKAIELDPNISISYTCLGIAFQVSNDLPGAIVQHQKAIELDPGDSNAYFNLGIVLQASDDLPGAIAQFQKVIELAPGNSNAYFNLGLAFQASNDLPEAITQFQKVIELDPCNSNAYFNLGLAFQASNDLPEAITQFQKTIELDPDNSNACFNLGLAFQASNDLPGAIAQFQKAIELNPENADAYIGLGYALQASNDLPGVIAQFQKAIELNPENADTYTTLGYAFQASNDLPGAIAQFQKAIELNPDDADTYAALGYALQASNDLPGAIAQFQKAIELNPDDADTYAALGYALQASNDLPGAIAQYKKAIELNPDDADTYAGLGYAFQASNDLPGAIAQYQKAIELNPDDAGTYTGLGYAFQASDDLPGAIAQFQKAIELNPDNAIYYYHLGNLLLKSKDFHGAIVNYQKAIEIKSGYADAWHGLGWVYLITHQLQNADDYLMKSWELWNKNNSSIAINLGHVELLKGNKENAIEWYKKSIQLNENIEDFFEEMESDFTDLQMEKHGISLTTYDNLLQKLRTFV
ncbi:tetratricopeptide repeat protein [Haliscomenobacter sp.]|uniref:tetratricopeptide repeat protein n=1 Tax=Haliscomenobacter sp. TaxID=2717303 RepID=UPI003BAD03D2